MKALRFSRSVLFAGLLALAASHASACEFNYSYRGSTEITNILGDSSLSDPSTPTADCERINRFTPFLEAHHILFDIHADHFVSHGVSIGWATVSLRDRYGLMSSVFSTETIVRPDPDDTAARQVMRNAAIDSISQLDIRKSLLDLRKMETRAGIKPIPVSP